MAQNKSSLELREFQSTESERSLYRAINELRIAMGLLPVNHSNSMEDQVYDRTILVKIHELNYSISCRELDMVFSRFGALEQVEIVSPSSQFHSRVCFQHIDSARRAFDFLNHRCVYDYCCRLELFLMRDIMIEPSSVIKDSLNDENGCNAGNMGIQEVRSLDSSLQETQNSSGTQDLESFELSVQGTQGNNSIQVFEDLEISGGSTEPIEMGVADDILLDSMENGVDMLIEIPTREVVVKTGPVNEETDDPLPEIDKDVEEIQLPDASLKVNSDSVEAIVSDIVESDKMSRIVDDSLDSMEIRGHENRVFDPGDFRDPRLAKRAGLEHLTFSMMEEVVIEQKCSYPSRVRANRMIMPYDRRKGHLPMIIFLGSGIERLVELLGVLREFLRSTDATSSFVFNPGGVSCAGTLCVESLIAVILTCSCWDMDGLILVFDLGGNFLIFSFEKKAKCALLLLIC